MGGRALVRLNQHITTVAYIGAAGCNGTGITVLNGAAVHIECTAVNHNRTSVIISRNQTAENTAVQVHNALVVACPNAIAGTLSLAGTDGAAALAVADGQGVAILHLKGSLGTESKAIQTDGDVQLLVSGASQISGFALVLGQIVVTAIDQGHFRHIGFPDDGLIADMVCRFCLRAHANAVAMGCGFCGSGFFLSCHSGGSHDHQTQHQHHSQKKTQ